MVSFETDASHPCLKRKNHPRNPFRFVTKKSNRRGELLKESKLAALKPFLCVGDVLDRGHLGTPMTKKNIFGRCA